MTPFDNPSHLGEEVISQLPDSICESAHNDAREDITRLKEGVESLFDNTGTSYHRIPSFYNHDMPDNYGDFNPGIGRFMQQTYTLNEYRQEELLPLIQEFAETIGYSDRLTHEVLSGSGGNGWRGLFGSGGETPDHTLYQQFRDFIAAKKPELANQITFGNLGEYDGTVNQIEEWGFGVVTIRVPINDFELDDGGSYIEEYYHGDRTLARELAQQYINALNTDPNSLKDWDVRYIRSTGNESGMDMNSARGEIIQEYITQELQKRGLAIPQFNIEYHAYGSSYRDAQKADTTVILSASREQEVNEFILGNVSDIYLIDASGSMSIVDNNGNTDLQNEEESRWDLVRAINYPKDSQLLTFTTGNSRSGEVCQGIDENLKQGGGDPVDESLMGTLPNMNQGTSITVVSDGQVTLPNARTILRIAQERNITINYVGIRFGMAELQNIAEQTGGNSKIVN